MGSNFGYSRMTPDDTASEHNVLSFIIRQIIGDLDTIKVVRVEAVHGGGSSAVPPTVDVLPLVSQVDGNNNAVGNLAVYGLPVLRLQGGGGAMVLDPVVGDIGIVVAADRDISGVIASGGQPSTPGSHRSFDIADGAYLGGILNAAPTFGLWFDALGHFTLQDKSGNKVVSSASGMTLFDATGNQIQMKTGVVNIVTGALQVNGIPVSVP